MPNLAASRVGASDQNSGKTGEKVMAQPERML